MDQSNRLTPADIDSITGIKGPGHEVAQRNRLRNMGIHAHVNDRREVVCFWSWVDAAALPEDLLNRYIKLLTPEQEEIDIGIDFSAVKSAHG